MNRGRCRLRNAFPFATDGSALDVVRNGMRTWRAFEEKNIYKSVEHMKV